MPQEPDLCGQPENRKPPSPSGQLPRVQSRPGQALCSLVPGFLLGWQVGSTADVMEEGQDLVSDSWGALLHWSAIPSTPPALEVGSGQPPPALPGSPSSMAPAPAPPPLTLPPRGGKGHSAVYSLGTSSTALGSFNLTLLFVAGPFPKPSLQPRREIRSVSS